MLIPLLSVASGVLLDLVPVAVWAVGFAYESIADEQLRRFLRRRDSDSSGGQDQILATAL